MRIPYFPGPLQVGGANWLALSNEMWVEGQSIEAPMCCLQPLSTLEVANVEALCENGGILEWREPGSLSNWKEKNLGNLCQNLYKQDVSYCAQPLRCWGLICCCSLALTFWSKTRCEEPTMCSFSNFTSSPGQDLLVSQSICVCVCVHKHDDMM